MANFNIIIDDLSGEAVRELIAMHLGDMHALSPPGHSFALGLGELKSPQVTVWSAWDGDKIAGVGALQDLEDGTGELKSMRTTPTHVRQGVAAAILEHIIDAARNAGMHRLSLETGIGADFEAAIQLYENRGFVAGESFSDYVRSQYNQFFHLQL